MELPEGSSSRPYKELEVSISGRTTRFFTVDSMNSTAEGARYAKIGSIMATDSPGASQLENESMHASASNATMNDFVSAYDPDLPTAR